MVSLNYLMHHETYIQENKGIFFWLATPVTEERRARTRERLPEYVRPLFDKMQLDCPNHHIAQFPVTLRGKRGIFISYFLRDSDVSVLCGNVWPVEEKEEVAVHAWLCDVAAKAENTAFVKDCHATVVVGFKTMYNESEWGLFVPEEFCVCRGMMEELTRKLASFMEEERKNVRRIHTLSGRIVLLCAEDAAAM